MIRYDSTMVRCDEIHYDSGTLYDLVIHLNTGVCLYVHSDNQSLS